MANPAKVQFLLPYVFTVILFASVKSENVKTKVFLSQKIHLTPGLVSNKIYPDMDFPRGKIALKSFDAELVDDKGKSVPLHQTYVHHWIVVKYFQPKPNSGLNQTNIIFANISGVCDNNVLTQYFGLGSETRRTPTYLPDPYGVLVGNPDEIPAGHDEKWMLNVHAIDTRGTVDRMGCIECRCDLYNVTATEDGRPLPSGYRGGLDCCYDQTRCKLKEGFRGMNRTIYLKYTVKYIDWNPAIIPARIYIMDVTSVVTKINTSTGIAERNTCQVEYDVPSCRSNNMSCTDTRSLNIRLSKGGNLVYATGHLHVGGMSISLYGDGRREICSSLPIYGKGRRAGNEDGYVVGMSTCYPSRGSVKISDGESLTLVSKYSRRREHTGVMGLLYFVLADS